MEIKRFRTIKPEIRIVGIDDGPHIHRKKSYVPIVGAVFRGGLWIEGVLFGKILVDGFDSTQAIADMITSSPHYKQVRVIMLNGVTFAGFNIVDLKYLNQKTNLPVISIVQKKPDLASFHKAIEHLSEPEKRLSILTNAGELTAIPSKNRKGTLFIQTAGILPSDAQKIIDLAATRSIVPEPLRVAHLIASRFSL